MRLLKVPFYRQPNDYWCGPAVAQMLIHRMLGKRVSQRKLARACGTKRTGTSVGGIKRGLRTLGLSVKSKTCGRFWEIRRTLRRGLPVGVIYREPDDEVLHFSIVIGLNRRHIVLNDPWNGRKFKLMRKEFLRRWKNWNYWRWMMWPVVGMKNRR